MPIKDSKVSNALSFTKGRPQRNSLWNGKLLRSLNLIDGQDGAVIEQALAQQQAVPVRYPYLRSCSSEGPSGKCRGRQRHDDILTDIARARSTG